jgi:hypothetical protein
MPAMPAVPTMAMFEAIAMSKTRTVTMVLSHGRCTEG